MISHKEKEHIKSQLLKISKGEAGIIEISRFINYLKNLVHNHLFLRKSSFLKNISQFVLDSIDVSIEVVAELFKRNNIGELITIKNFLNKLNSHPEKINADDFFQCFMGLIWKISEVTIAKIYSEYDEIGSKILRNIRNHLPNDQLELYYFCGENYIRVRFENNDHLPYLNFDEFKNTFLAHKIYGNNIPELLEYLADSLSSLKEYRKEIRLLEAVILFKEIYLNTVFNNKLLNDENEYFFIDDLSINIDLEILKQKCLALIQTKLFNYSRKNRFTDAQIRAIYFSMQDILHDLLYNGGIQIPFLSYLRKYISLTENEYSLIFKTKIEYLNKIVRQEIINYLDI